MSEVTVKWDGKEATVRLKKMSWGDQKKLIKEAIGKVRMLGGETPQFEIDLAEFLEALVRYSISEAPFEPNAENLSKLSSDDMNRLVSSALELNPFRELITG